jgi:DNA end-binding protein Ku
MPHAIWKGAISFGLVTIPVGLYAAVARNELSFHLYDSRDLSPVHNRRVNQTTGDEVPWESIVKGYELPDGRLVTLAEEDFSAANVRATRTIDVLGAVCMDQIDVAYFDSPYFLAPDETGRKAYALLRETLRAAGRAAVGQIVIRSRQHIVAIVPEGDALLLEVLRYPHELRSSDGLELPGEDLDALGVTEAEVTLAKQLVATIETDWDPSSFRDTYHDDLLALIERKAEGEAVAPAPEPEAAAAQVVDIVELLKRSVAEARAARGESDAGSGAAATG